MEPKHFDVGQLVSNLYLKLVIDNYKESLVLALVLGIHLLGVLQYTL